MPARSSAVSLMVLQPPAPANTGTCGLSRSQGKSNSAHLAMAGDGRYCHSACQASRVRSELPAGSEHGRGRHHVRVRVRPTDPLCLHRRRRAFVPEHLPVVPVHAGRARRHLRSRREPGPRVRTQVRCRQRLHRPSRDARAGAADRRLHRDVVQRGRAGTGDGSRAGLPGGRRPRLDGEAHRRLGRRDPATAEGGSGGRPVRDDRVEEDLHAGDDEGEGDHLPTRVRRRLVDPGALSAEPSGAGEAGEPSGDARIPRPHLPSRARSCTI